MGKGGRGKKNGEGGGAGASPTGLFGTNVSAVALGGGRSIP